MQKLAPRYYFQVAPPMTCFTRYVYERLAGKRRAGFKELLLTQLVNALWHGIAPRYLVFFVHSVFFIQFSSVISRFESLLPAAAARSYAWRGLKVRPLSTCCVRTAMSWLPSTAFHVTPIENRGTHSLCPTPAAFWQHCYRNLSA